MNIREIRDAIKWVRACRLHLTSPSAFCTVDIPTKLGAYIAELKALTILNRFTTERQARDEEIGHCEDVIRRWKFSRVTAVLRGPGGFELPLGEGVDPARIAFDLAVEKPDETVYTDGVRTFRVINGGKKC